MVERGGRQDVFLGTRDCQGYVEPCRFGEGEGELDNDGRLDFGLMFHGFDYPDETGENKLYARFWRPVMVNGVIHFDPPESCRNNRKFVRPMTAKPFRIDQSVKSVEKEAELMEALP
jgi:CRISPR-associated protein Cas5d